MRFQNPITLNSLAIANGATTPVPGGGAGSMAWSTTVNGTVTWNGTAWFDEAAMGGSTGAIQFNNSTVLGGSTGLTWDDTNKVMTITGATVATSQPALNLSQTWNAAAIAFSAAKINITVTASNGSGKLLDLQRGGAFVGGFDENGMALGTAVQVVSSGTVGFWAHPSFASMASANSLQWSSSGGANISTDLSLYRDAAGTLAIRTSTAAQAFRVYATYTDISNYRRFSITTTTTGITTLAPQGLGTGAAGNAFVLASNPFFPQPAQIAQNAAATLAIATLLAGLITTTNTAAIILTLPTGTLSDAGCGGGNIPVDNCFDWNLINLAASIGTVTIAAGTGHTIVGNAVVAIGSSAMFRSRKTAANTFITYRIA